MPSPGDRVVGSGGPTGRGRWASRGGRFEKATGGEAHAMDHETPFRIALLVIFVLGMPIGGYHRFKAAASRERLSRREEGFVLIPLRLCGLVTFGGIIAYLIDPEWMRWSALPLPHALRWAGAVVGAASLPLLLWTLA